MSLKKAEDSIATQGRPFTGAEFLESLRDGREVYIYGERVEDVTTHPALWLELMPRQPATIQVSTRIGLSRDQHRRLRFVERGSPFLSVPP